MSRFEVSEGRKPLLALKVLWPAEISEELLLPPIFLMISVLFPLTTYLQKVFGATTQLEYPVEEFP